MIRPEVLAPAGTFESLQAAIRAGADAVYLGGSAFGARAYAGNFDREELLRAIEYAHVHGRRLYLTVNTLVKEAELPAVAEYLVPFYEAGIDAVIVQDLGVVRMIRRLFPELPIHASTQMAVADVSGARLLDAYGVRRLVMPRELSLPEIRLIREQTGLEIEAFVHGALCYCSSGQCLMSSLIGGRSGNRGRCAQPCRLEYDVYRGSEHLNNAKETHLLSPKDINTAKILPELVAAGVHSLKIEGRMKKPVYAAGVAEVYRRLADRLMEGGPEKYYVTAEEEQQLFDLFNRSGFSESYYKQYNGKHMMALAEKPFRFANEALQQRLEETYLTKEVKEPVTVEARFAPGEPVSLTLSCADPGSRPAFAADVPTQETVSVTVTGPVAEPASKRPLSAEDAKKQLARLGDTPFEASDIRAEIAGDVFVPVSALNALRREAAEALVRALADRGRRAETATAGEMESVRKAVGGGAPAADVLITTLAQAEAVLAADFPVRRLYAESDLTDAAGFAALQKRCQTKGIRLYLALPYVFRERGKKRVEALLSGAGAPAFGGFLVRSMDGLGWVKEAFPEANVCADAGLYSWNGEAKAFLEEQGVSDLTAPLEQSRRELADRGLAGETLVVYGRVPMMISAQCLQKNTTGCRKDTTQPHFLDLRDRKGEHLPVRTSCADCQNVIFNSRRTCLFGKLSECESLHPAALRIDFTDETAEEVQEVLEKFAAGEDTPKYTRGHFTRGVE